MPRLASMGVFLASLIRPALTPIIGSIPLLTLALRVRRFSVRAAFAAAFSIGRFRKRWMNGQKRTGQQCH
jgi:hypothetical protein